MKEEVSGVGRKLGISVSRSDGRMNPSHPLRCKAMSQESPAGKGGRCAPNATAGPSPVTNRHNSNGGVFSLAGGAAHPQS